MLNSEWTTIDTAVHRLDISAKLEAEINDHIYLKYDAHEFACQDGTITLPVSAAVSVLLGVFVKIISTCF